MVYFTGRYENSVDSKGRLAMPAKFRKLFPPEHANTVILTRGVAKCITAYTVDEWQYLLQVIDNLDLSAIEKDNLSRFFLGNMAEVNFDSQGRILIPVHLIQHAELKGDALISGIGNRIEIWNAEHFKNQIVASEQHVTEILSKYSLARRQEGLDPSRPISER